ncbi:hypothetical protein [Vibrio sp. YYF0003]|uniref:hypothetical protein n=1 Tax=Vibrio sp. YYF0003 TaxID=3116646 RepID=UPI002EC324A3|nr:hypothetical protein [Vibrio sp. YYF0003]
MFTRIDRQRAVALGIQKQGYSRNLDSFCDYFELPTVEYAENDVRRYYIRQHQLRRFFAMVFFWLRGAASLDTLRYFLCHTDSEHLYHYVTEGLQGEVLVGIKARSIREGLTSGHVQNIEKLLPILRRRYGVDYLKLRGFREVLSDYAHYDEDEAQFTPPLERIREQFEQEIIDFEADISRLLLEGTIDLQPEFFTVMDADGHVITDYKIILRVTEEV